MQQNEKIAVRTAEYRPCIVKGRRALFHRWSDNARPVRPRGMEDNEEAQHFQIWSVHAIVEYEDGRLSRVWPNDIQFVDGGHFEDYDWPQDPTEDLPFEYTGPESNRNPLPPVPSVDMGVGYFRQRYKCPKCGKRIASYTYGKDWTENGLSEEERVDCHNCGQAIDWEGIPYPNKTEG